MAEKEGDPIFRACTYEKQILFSFQVGKVKLGPFLSVLAVLIVLTPDNNVKCKICHNDPKKIPIGFLNIYIATFLLDPWFHIYLLTLLVYQKILYEKCNKTHSIVSITRKILSTLRLGFNRSKIKIK